MTDSPLVPECAEELSVRESAPAASRSAFPTATRFAMVAAALVAFSGCPDNPSLRCPEECDRGFEGDPVSRSCVEAPRPVFRDALPGRALATTNLGDTIWVAAVDESDGSLVAGELRPGAGETESRVIATIPRSDDRRLAIEASDSIVVLAWLNASGQYDLAWRDVAGSHAVWRFATVGGDYAGSDDFAVAVRADDGVALLFRDRERVVRVANADSPSGPWQLETVDAGGVTDDNIACPEELRRDAPAVGVGFDPAIIARGGQLVAAYYDADCGDLRVARRQASQWSVVVADTGDSSQAGDRGFTGRWPSLTYDPSGVLGIAYHDMSRGQLMFATEQDDRFAVEVVDTGIEVDAFSRERRQIVGAFADAWTDAEGTTSIVYLDGSNADLMLATREVGDEWTSRTLVGTGAVGFHAGIAGTTSLGRYATAERVTPSADGIQSEFVLIEVGQ